MNKMRHKPPKLAEWLLKMLLSNDFWKTTLGDFEEYYYHLASTKGIWKAKSWYWSQVLRFAPSKITHNIIWIVAMFKNYLKISYRSLKNNLGYSFINIFGLAVGLACFVLIALFIRYEYSYDTHHKKSERVYRIVRHNPLDNYLGSSWAALTPIPLASKIKEDLPEIESATYLTTSSAFFYKDQESFAQNGISVDGDFFDVFTHNWIYGNPDLAMDDPESMVITHSLSKKYFGSENPVGQVIDVIVNRDNKSKTITGVIEDVNPTSHFSFDFIINERSTEYYDYNSKEWSNTNHYTYIALKEGIDSESVQEKLPAFTTANFGKSGYYERNPDRIPILHLQPLTDIHLKSSHLNFNISNHGDIKYIYMFGAVALIILIIACVNYMNLATARSLLRAKEIGVRKVIGAIRSNLIIQFISEAIIISGISIIFAFFIIYLFLPAFNTLVDRPLSAAAFLNIEFILIALAISLCVGIFSGSYPALYMSALKPVLILKSQIKGGKGNRFLRNALVISQFTITIVLVISSIVVFRQLDYVQTTDTGLDREQIVAISIFDRTLWDRYETLEAELEKNSGIKAVSTSNFIPTRIAGRTSGAQWEGKLESESMNIYNSGIGFGYTEMLGLELVAGRHFSKELYKETVTDYLLNESAVNELGWTPEEAIGKTFAINGSEGPIVGVLKDFNFLSLHLEVAPLTLYSNPKSSWNNYILVKVAGNNIPETLDYMKAQLKEFSPNYPFNYSFLDDSFDNMYKTELQLGSMFNYLTILALIIASLGLFGLAAFITEQRTKEIGIRKVLGAGVLQIIALVNKDFIKLVAISFIMAAPIGWYLMDTWLKDFAYRIDLNITIFALSGILAIGIALITVSYKSVKTALLNPITSLRNE